MNFIKPQNSSFYYIRTVLAFFGTTLLKLVSVNLVMLTVFDQFHILFYCQYLCKFRVSYRLQSAL